MKYSSGFIKWMRFSSPLFIATLFSLVEIVICLLSQQKNDGWSTIFAIILVPVALVLLVVDGISKLFIKNLLVLWVTQIVLLALGVLIIYLQQS